MKKIKEFTKRNLKVIVAFIIGIMISGVGVYAATILYNANEIGYDNTRVAINKNNANVTNVQDAIEVLYEKAEGPCKLKLGDYFTLTPTATSFTITAATTGYTRDQTINPSELNLWRVIDIHKDGSFDAVSEYVSSTAVYFRGTTGYANFVGGLQTIAASYAKPGYTIATRMMGYAGQTPTIQTKSETCTGTCQTTTTYAFDGSTNSAPSQTGTPTSTTWTGQEQEYSGGVLGDTLYLKDYALVSNVYKSDTATYGSTGLKAYNVSSKSSAKDYWLVSRRVRRSNGVTNWYFSGRYVDASGSLSSYDIRVFYDSWRDYSSNSYSLRPILTLKSGITVSGGSGTKASPYTIS